MVAQKNYCDQIGKITISRIIGVNRGKLSLASRNVLSNGALGTFQEIFKVNLIFLRALAADNFHWVETELNKMYVIKYCF